MLNICYGKTRPIEAAVRAGEVPSLPPLKAEVIYTAAAGTLRFFSSRHRAMISVLVPG